MSCYREVNGVYFVKTEHRGDCEDPECRGCRACPEPHCTGRKTCAVHVGEDEITCPRCIARTRASLRRIPALTALAMPVAIATGVNSEAANLAGPAADPEAWSWRKVAARQGRSWHLSLIEDDDERHPYSVLGRWALMIAEDYGHDLPTLTVTRAAEYLDRNLARIANDPEQDWALLSAEVRKCRRALEAADALAAHRERGAPCPTCKSDDETKPAPRLIRVYPHWCDDEDCARIHHEDASEDYWECPRDRAHTWTEKAYRDYIEERKVKAG